MHAVCRLYLMVYVLLVGDCLFDELVLWSVVCCFGLNAGGICLFEACCRFVFCLCLWFVLLIRGCLFCCWLVNCCRWGWTCRVSYRLVCMLLF